MPAKTTKVIDKVVEPRPVRRLYDIQILLKNGEKFFLHEIGAYTRHYILKQYNHGVKHLHIPMERYVNFEDKIKSPEDRFIQMDTIAELKIKPFNAKLVEDSQKNTFYPEYDGGVNFRYDLDDKEWKPL